MIITYFHLSYQKINIIFIYCQMKTHFILNLYPQSDLYVCSFDFLHLKLLEYRENSINPHQHKKLLILYVIFQNIVTISNVKTQKYKYVGSFECYNFDVKTHQLLSPLTRSLVLGQVFHLNPIWDVGEINLIQ